MNKLDIEVGKIEALDPDKDYIIELKDAVIGDIETFSAAIAASGLMEKRTGTILITNKDFALMKGLK